MNFYVHLISTVVDYVEANIQQSLTLEDLAGQFGFSAFHFNRMFRTVSGQTLKQYILGRKLSLAMGRLETGADPVIEIAYDFGFNSPEVFSRAFKKQFGISPNDYRKRRPPLASVPRPTIVERDMASFEGQIALKGHAVYLERIPLAGMRVEVNAYRPDFKDRLQNANDAFCGQFHPQPLYVLVNCSGDEDDGNYHVFYGLAPARGADISRLAARDIPAGWYEQFSYTGDMFDIRASFTDDLYRWLIIKEIELAPNGIGMLNVFQADYPQTQTVEILVPVKPNNR